MTSPHVQGMCRPARCACSTLSRCAPGSYGAVALSGCLLKTAGGADFLKSCTEKDPYLSRHSHARRRLAPIIGRGPQAPVAERPYCAPRSGAHIMLQKLGDQFTSPRG